MLFKYEVELALCFEDGHWSAIPIDVFMDEDSETGETQGAIWEAAVDNLNNYLEINHLTKPVAVGMLKNNKVEEEQDSTEEELPFKFRADWINEV